MILIAAIDDKNGLTFNKRRLSQDRILRENILDVSKGSTLWMDTYTAKQFTELPVFVSVDDAWPMHARPGEYAFLERMHENLKISDIKQIILYKWNRDYPADTYFPVDLGRGWYMETTEDFRGHSHDKITKEVWICKER